MQIKNTSESNSASRSRSVQKSKHWNFKDRNIYKFATYSFKHATEQDHVT